MFAKIRSTGSALAQNWKLTSKAYPFLALEVLGFFLAAALVVGLPVGLLLNPLSAVIIAIPSGLLAATFWFSRRAMKAAYKSIEGQPGAGVAVIQSMRGAWLVTPAVSVNKNQDMVSRVVGRPGVILVAEGPSTRVTHLLANERKKTARWVPEVPIFEIQVGNEEGQVPLLKLQSSLTKLPRNLRPAEVTDLRRRLDAVSQTGGGLPIPKGPVPTSARSVRRPR